MRWALATILAAPLLSAPSLADNARPAPPAGKITADAGKGGKQESLEDVLQQAATAGDRPADDTQAAADKQPDPPKAASPEKKPVAASAAVKGPVAAANPAKAAEPTAPPTDDNDATERAAAPTALAAVQQTREPRHRGPYDLGNLDCRVLDGAGIERLLPKRIIAGEEPDLLCRLVVTQPPTVSAEEHSVTLTVNVGPRETFRQVRRVRMSSVGRRALVFVVPADKISSDDPVQVKVHALLSAPALPGGGRDVSFTVESED